MKKHYKSLLIFLLILAGCFVFYYFNTIKTHDEMWNYGFAYNIATGLVPYRDFNMVITPLYSFLLGGFIKIIGNSFFCLMILNSFITATIIFIFYKKLSKKIFLLIPILLFSSDNCYNILSLLLFMLLITKEETKYKNNEYLTGFIVALLLLTKHTVGGVLFILSFLLSKKKKDYLIGFLPICIIFLLYLWFSNALYNFFDYCLFGLFDFAEGNGLSGINYVTLLYLLIIIVFLIQIKKNKFKDKQANYILAFQSISLPIFDFQHIFIAIIPVFYYLIRYETKGKLMSIILNYKKDDIIDSIKKVLIYLTFSATFALCFLAIVKNENSYVYHNKTSFLNNVLISYDVTKRSKIADEIKTNYPDYRYFYFNDDAFLIKLVNNDVIDKYDLINKGNMGYHGEEKYINEVNDYCTNNKCLFVIEDKVPEGQLSAKIYNYVKDNYTYEKTEDEYEIYIN